MFRYEKDGDGIVVVTMDMPGGANVMNAAYRDAMKETVERLEAEQGLAGVVFASAKSTFFAGGDLTMLVAETEAGADFFAWVEEGKGFLRRLERLPVPVVAAINGAALGGGYEICLACNRRIVVNDPKATVGVPEVTLGLLPGAGGCVRIPALIGLEKALPVLLRGRPHKPEEALKLGLVDEMVPTREDLIPAAKDWIKASPDSAVQPWDRKGFVHPGGGAQHPKVRQVIAFAPTMLIKETRGLIPAPEAILDVAANSLRMSFDSALRFESRRFCGVVRSQEAKNMTTAFFFQMQALNKGGSRPEAPRWAPKSSAVLGAGMMGSGIAHAHATRGISAVVTDRSPEKAEGGREKAVALLDGAAKKGRLSAERRDAAAKLLCASTNDALGTPDVIVEAVFEDLALKERIIAETFPALAEGGIYGSNTSTLPIGLLAEACPEPERFVGLHFFSPVEKMRLVEIIRGEKTSDETLAKAFDYVQAIGKIPVVVNDGRGFFTSRVFGTYLDEGCALLRDGASPALIERAGWVAGMPVGPLQVFDEVSLELSNKVAEAHRMLDERLGVENGFPADKTATAAVVAKMLAAGRGGRHYGGGFYDYGEGGRRLWPGLSDLAERSEAVTLEEARDRLLYRMSLETLRCLEEGVLTSERDGNIGSIFAFGFPASTGGAIQFARGEGLEAFRSRAETLTQRWGARFAPPADALARLSRSDALAA
ncbi:MAG TPA: 3-hydroxyacyl-CoA dehydrogenase NAD-binding domain-containing protein [Paracoccaceae bacterium]|nr:3-hydroxyacyl-CoA dehydrogenase NAD-binding domain-containing protein [Paracoccaceae bacterium]